MINARQKPITILLVEDIADHRELIKIMLEGGGYAVSSADNGERAWELLMAVRPGKDAPDLIITDLRLPGLNGLELIRRIRAMPGLGNIPIIATTAEHDLLLERALEYGANAVLHKPLSEALVDLIEQLLPQS